MLNPTTPGETINQHGEDHSSYDLDHVINALEDGFVLTDIHNHLLLVNQSAKKIFGVSGSELQGKLVDEIFSHPDFLDIFTPYKPMPYQNEVEFGDGRVFRAQASYIPETGIAVILHDISHLKEIDRVKTDFVNTVSHDLRSPLTAVYGFIGLIDRVGPINQQQAEFLRHIESSLQNITSLINDLLDLGRLEANQDVLMVEVSLKGILEQVIDDLEYQSSKKMQELTLSAPDELPPITGNPLHLRRMFGNLIENSIKFTQIAGKVSIHCRADAGQLIIEVADNGPGISLADQPHVFEKFYRGSSQAQETAGTGLGLAIVKTIVEKHQGRIWLESSPRGTTFTIILPTK